MMVMIKKGLMKTLPETRPNNWLSNFTIAKLLPRPKLYVQKLEKVLIKTLEEWGIVGCRHESLRGVWVKHDVGHLEKIASIGVRILKGITMHGFALNVNVDLQPFSLLTPRGIENCKVTSIEKLLGQEVNSEEVRKRLATNFAEIFNLEWTEQK